MFTTRRAALACTAACLAAAPLGAQLASLGPSGDWRSEAAAIGTTARVLIIGAHPDDEDNALIAWLSLGRHVETAYLSLTRGENGVNVLGRERESLLGMVRTAEVLAERRRDGAHQYFTRAYDFGFARNDSVAYAGWPRDSVLRDVVTVLRVFRPQVVISLFTADSTNHDGQHQVAGELARAAFILAGDTTRMPSAFTSRVGGWTVGAFYQLVDTAGPRSIAIDVGALDNARARSYAEIGAEIRKLQRTQVAVPAPPVGAVIRYLQRELADDSPASAGVESSLFADLDTTWARFAALPLADSARTPLDSLIATISSSTATQLRDSQDSTIAYIARIARLSADARREIHCTEPAATNCSGALADLAQSLSTTRDRAVRALLDARGIVIDVTAAREPVAIGDSVAVTASVYNGGPTSIGVDHVLVLSRLGPGVSMPNPATIAPDSVGRWSGMLKIGRVAHPGWLTSGLVDSTWLYVTGATPRFPVDTRLLMAEDRTLTTTAEVALRIDGTDVIATVGPVMARAPTELRGDERHPVTGVPGVNLLLERAHEYARAVAPFERLERVWVGSSESREDTVRVEMDLPGGISTDSAARVVVLPPFGSRTIFFRLHGRWPVGVFPFHVIATPDAARARPSTSPGNRSFTLNTSAVTDGLVSFEYPHIPTQRLPVSSTDSVTAVDVAVPRDLRVAYVRSNRDDQLDSRIAEFGVTVYAVDPSQLAVTDLSWYSTILIGPHAFTTVESLQPNAGAIRRFAERGGTVVVLIGRDELSAPGVLPYPVTFGAVNDVTALDPNRAVRLIAPQSSLLTWPNRITLADFANWTAYRARELPASFDARYRPLLEMVDDAHRPTESAILSARVGKGTFIYTALSLDHQVVVGTHAGAARLLVNLLAAGLNHAAAGTGGSGNR